MKSRTTGASDRRTAQFHRQHKNVMGCGNVCYGSELALPRDRPNPNS